MTRFCLLGLSPCRVVVMVLVVLFYLPVGCGHDLTKNSRRLEQEGVSLLPESQSADEHDADVQGPSTSPRAQTHRAVRNWNLHYCKVHGCKPATAYLFDMMQDNPLIQDEFITRNGIADPLYNLSSEMVPLALNRTVPYLGVLLDAGRNYYPIEWIHNLLQLMHAMGYNLLHFRLTGDQAFNIELESMPELANAALDSGGRVYKASELKDLVSFANKLNITIMPEINVPGHSGGWAGNHTPNLILPCAQYICDKAIGLPLNLTHPKLQTMVRQVLVEVLDIFHTTPFLHLGGDELDLFASCLHEVRKKDYATDLAAFEQFLQTLMAVELKGVQVVRWSHRGDNDANKPSTDKRAATLEKVPRVADITHYAYSSDYPNITDLNPVFTSTDLHFNTNDQKDAFDVFETTRRITNPKNPQPLAVIVGTFELGPYQWFDRNVIGRLVAVALGASSLDVDDQNFEETYNRLCVENLHLDRQLCLKKGVPFFSRFSIFLEMQELDMQFQSMLCNRLTKKVSHAMVTKRKWTKRTIAEKAMSTFWTHFADDPPEFASAPLEVTQTNDTLSFVREKSDQSQVPFRGISLDLVRIDSGGETMERMLATLELMYMLGLNTLQLRLMSDTGFALEIPQHNNLLWGYEDRFCESEIRTIVKHARALGIQVIPEITTATRAGGWFGAGVLADCSKLMCSTGIGMGVNVTDTDFIAIIISVLHHLIELFDHPPYIHLGFDEREEVKACYDEAQLEVDLNEFERRLVAALKFQDFDESKLIRWENSEGVLYPGRAGRVTHYRLSKPITPGEPAFISSGLNLGDPNMVDMNAWSVYEQTRKLVSYKPTGVVAVVDILHSTFWKDFAIAPRLMAYAIGLAKSDLNKLDFEEQLRQALVALNFDDDHLGKTPNAETSRKHVEKSLEVRNQRACVTRVTKVARIVPKEGWLV